jgi:hypothetical protein
MPGRIEVNVLPPSDTDISQRHHSCVQSARERYRIFERKSHVLGFKQGCSIIAAAPQWAYITRTYPAGAAADGGTKPGEFMKLTASLTLSLATMVAVGTACGASTLGKSSTGATSTGSTVIITPELQNADARVKQASSQLELAKKQLKAAQSILKAAEADLKAAKSEREAIALRTQAQGLASEAGMKPEGNKALAEVDSAAMTKNGLAVPMPAATTDPATEAPNATPNPTQAADQVAPQLELR